MYKKSRTSAWKEGGGSPLDSTSHYSEMPGELSKYKNEQHKKAMNAPIDQDKIRKAGL
jgi:hypothetical protein